MTLQRTQPGHPQVDVILGLRWAAVTNLSAGLTQPRPSTDPLPHDLDASLADKHLGMYDRDPHTDTQRDGAEQASLACTRVIAMSRLLASAEDAGATQRGLTSQGWKATRGGTVIA